jgi:hypothetical protein
MTHGEHGNRSQTKQTPNCLADHRRPSLLAMPVETTVQFLPPVNFLHFASLNRQIGLSAMRPLEAMKSK